ncbi:MAG: RluA family pseudouridine synthase [Acidaminobacteraceae bacterium]
MREIIIGKNEAGQRLDRYLGKYLNNSNRNNIYKLIRKKVFKINDVRMKSEEYFLVEGDILKIFLSEETLETLIKEEKVYDADYVGLEIVFEDDEILVVNKPKGLLTHPDKNEYKDTLSSKVQMYLRHLSTRTFKPASIQRLDKNTSGIVMFCKTYDSLKNFNEMMRNRELDKYYIAVVEGIITESGQITGFLEKDEAKNKVVLRHSQKKDSDKYCDTKYRPIRTVGGKYTLMEVQLLTGRAHQIRVSMSYIGHPIVGDSKYGAKSTKKVNNQLLHGYKLIINNKSYIESGKQNEFQSDSREIEAFLKSL